jgi:hypothetical protein
MMTGLEAMLLVGASTVVMLAWGLLADTSAGDFSPGTPWLRRSR